MKLSSIVKLVYLIPSWLILHIMFPKISLNEQHRDNSSSKSRSLPSSNKPSLPKVKYSIIPCLSSIALYIILQFIYYRFMAN